MGIAVLASSCGQKAETNPFFAEWDTPFGMPPFDQIELAHYKPAVEEGIKRESAEIQAIIDNTEEPSFENVVLAYDNSGQFLNRVMMVFGALNSADTNPEMQALDEELTPMLTQHSNEIAMNPALFAKVKAVYDKRESLSLDSIQMRLLDKMYKGFERSGANLPDADKEKLKGINEKLSMLSLQFGKNLLADTKAFTVVIEDSAELAGLPESVIAGAAAAAQKRDMAGKWLFTLDKPSWIPFLQYSTNAALREKLYNGWLMQGNNDNANDNKQVINDIVKYRIEKAQLLGFDTWADFVLDRQMAKTPAAVYDLLNQIWTAALAQSKKELAELQKVADAEQGGQVKSSDWWFYAEKVRKAKYDLDEEMTRPYFSLETVRDGIFLLSNKLYGITFVAAPEAPKYHPDVMVYDVKDTDGSHLGALTMDFFPRPGKRGGAWCGSFVPQSYENGVRVAPIKTIVCNFTPPSGDAPALLSLDEVETFFHEFGHALHGLFADVKYRGMGGTERDFVELPSQVMEHWAVEPEFLKMYAKHYSTGEAIPDALIEKISLSGTFNQGFMTNELAAAALLDMDVHTKNSYAPFDVNAYQAENLNKIGEISVIEPRYRYPYFQHIFSGGYSSGYYSYLWSEVLDADAFEAYTESGNIFNPEIAARFRTLLSKGGTEDGMDLYREFRGKTPSIEPLMKNRGLK